MWIAFRQTTETRISCCAAENFIHCLGSNFLTCIPTHVVVVAAVAGEGGGGGGGYTTHTPPTNAGVTKFFVPKLV